MSKTTSLTSQPCNPFEQKRTDTCLKVHLIDGSTARLDKWDRDDGWLYGLIERPDGRDLPISYPAESVLRTAEVEVTEP